MALQTTFRARLYPVAAGMLTAMIAHSAGAEPAAATKAPGSAPAASASVGADARVVAAPARHGEVAPAAASAPGASASAASAPPAAAQSPAAQSVPPARAGDDRSEKRFDFPALGRQAPPSAPGIGTVPTTPLPGQPAAGPGGVSAPAAAPGGEVVEVTQAVPPTHILGVDLVPHHYDQFGYAESPEGLLIVEMDPQVGPITMFRGTQPHYIEAQFVNTQRDAVWLARKGAINDVLPNGRQYRIPYGYGAIKRSLIAVSLVEAQLQPHISDSQKSYELFPLEDLYLGAVASLAGLRAEARYVREESLVGYAQAGLNLAAMVGLGFNRTYGSYAVPLVLGGGVRYPALVSFLGSNWTSGAELLLGVGGVDDDQDTPSAVLVPGLVQEFEWAFRRDIDVRDYRSDPRPSNYGVQSVFAKAGLYADFLGATKSILFDVHVGYRFNLQGPKIPPHQFKETKITYASERYVARKREEKRRQEELEQLRKRREQGGPAQTSPYPTYPAPGAPAQTSPYPTYPAPGAPPGQTPPYVAPGNSAPPAQAPTYPPAPGAPAYPPQPYPPQPYPPQPYPPQPYPPQP